ncbi:MAG: hypothetical protein Q9202_004260 [Teloschistes flavicans]
MPKRPRNIPRYWTVRRPISQPETFGVVTEGTMENSAEPAALDADPGPNYIRFNQSEGKFEPTYDSSFRTRPYKEFSAMLREIDGHRIEVQQILDLVTSRREILGATFANQAHEVSEWEKKFWGGVDEATGKVVAVCEEWVKEFMKHSVTFHGSQRWIFELPPL